MGTNLLAFDCHLAQRLFGCIRQFQQKQKKVLHHRSSLLLRNSGFLVSWEEEKVHCNTISKRLPKKKDL